MKRKSCMRAMALSLGLFLAFPVCGYAAETEQPALEEDFYDAVNYERLSEWKLAPDDSSVSYWTDLYENNNKRLIEIAREAAEDTEAEAGSDTYNIGAFYLTGMDTEARNEGGFGEAAGAFLRDVEQAGSVEELLESCLSLNRQYSFYSLIGLTYWADGEDSSQKSLYLFGGDMGLSKEVWFSEEEGNQNQVEAFRTYVRKLFEINGMTEEDAARTEEKTTELMKEMAGAALSLAEQYDAANTYNVYQVSDLPELYAGKISLETLEDIFGISPDEKLIVQDVGLIQKLGEILAEEDLETLQNYVKLILYRDLAQYVDLESFETQQTYENAVYGLEESKEFEQTLLATMHESLGFELGRVFCEQYFPDEAKDDIASIVEQVLEVFENRLEKLDWMSPATREQAIQKLQAIDVRIGYPDEWPQDSYELVLERPEEGGLYVDNYMEAIRAATETVFEESEEPVDKSQWQMYPQEINAYYDPSSNSISILAGVLDAPFYDPEAEPESNLGGIGMIIGHEITHAFDSYGSQYDAEGNLRNWWTDEDLQYFWELGQQVVEYYDGMEIDGLSVNGEQTLGENIADLGGLSCCMEIAENSGYDLRKVLEAYATIWAEKYRPEYLSDALANDTHSPSKIRVNAVVSAMDEFYEVYDVEKGDKMYVAPEARPEIW